MIIKKINATPQRKDNREMTIGSINILFWSKIPKLL